MGISSTLYNALFKRTSTFALTVVAGAFMFEAFVDEVSEKTFNYVNQGKLWHHIKDKYPPKE